MRIIVYLLLFSTAVFSATNTNAFRDRYDALALMRTNNAFGNPHQTNIFTHSLFGASKEFRSVLSNSPAALRSLENYDELIGSGNGLYWGSLGLIVGGGGVCVGLAFGLSYGLHIDANTGLALTLGTYGLFITGGLIMSFVGVDLLAKADNKLMHAVWAYNGEISGAPDIYKRSTFIESYDGWSSCFERADKSVRYTYSGFGTDARFIRLLRTSSDANTILAGYEGDIIAGHCIMWPGVAIALTAIFGYYTPVENIPLLMTSEANKNLIMLGVYIGGFVIELIGGGFLRSSYQRLQTAVWLYNRDVCDGKAELTISENIADTRHAVRCLIGPASFALLF